MAEDKNKWVTDFRAVLTRRATVKEDLDALVQEFNARGWSGNISQGDITGDNAEITPQMVSDAIGTVAAEDTLWAGGHATNVYKMYKR